MLLNCCFRGSDYRASYPLKERGWDLEFGRGGGVGVRKAPAMEVRFIWPILFGDLA